MADQTAFFKPSGIGGSGFGYEAQGPAQGNTQGYYQTQPGGVPNNGFINMQSYLNANQYAGQPQTAQAGGQYGVGQQQLGQNVLGGYTANGGYTQGMSQLDRAINSAYGYGQQPPQQNQPGVQSAGQPPPASQPGPPLTTAQQAGVAMSGMPQFSNIRNYMRQ